MEYGLIANSRVMIDVCRAIDRSTTESRARYFLAIFTNSLVHRELRILLHINIASTQHASISASK